MKKPSKIERCDKLRKCIDRARRIFAYRFGAKLCILSYFRSIKKILSENFVFEESSSESSSPIGNNKIFSSQTLNRRFSFAIENPFRSKDRGRILEIDDSSQIRESLDDCCCSPTSDALSVRSFFEISGSDANVKTVKRSSLLPECRLGAGVAEQLLVRKLESVCPRISPLFSILDPTPNSLSLFESPNLCNLRQQA